MDIKQIQNYFINTYNTCKLSTAQFFSKRNNVIACIALAIFSTCTVALFIYKKRSLKATDKTLAKTDPSKETSRTNEQETNVASNPISRITVEYPKQEQTTSNTKPGITIEHPKTAQATSNTVSGITVEYPKQEQLISGTGIPKGVAFGLTSHKASGLGLPSLKDMGITVDPKSEKPTSNAGSELISLPTPILPAQQQTINQSDKLDSQVVSINYVATATLLPESPITAAQPAIALKTLIEKDDKPVSQDDGSVAKDKDQQKQPDAQAKEELVVQENILPAISEIVKQDQEASAPLQPQEPITVDNTAEEHQPDEVSTLQPQEPAKAEIVLVAGEPEGNKSIAVVEQQTAVPVETTAKPVVPTKVEPHYNSREWDGAFDEKGEPHGYGTFIAYNGGKFIGHFEHGVLHDTKGKFIYPDGETVSEGNYVRGILQPDE
ncbi:MAG: hypothetical protein H0W88_12060 [Parachlamydiaceae bacterium]|nr:hypothetical protein [Parachlamydiaceae bacterium]